MRESFETAKEVSVLCMLIDDLELFELWSEVVEQGKCDGGNVESNDTPRISSLNNVRGAVRRFVNANSDEIVVGDQ